ncbi:tetratricopeptide repeat protein [candidate division TA06 bacterium]|nr:tetratricopeptide repeat protein [candidate division TA06 bacterium]
MSKSLGKYASQSDWLNAIWHIRMERLSIANLLGDRKLERGELEFLETWSTHLNQEDRTLQLLESRLRYLLDTGDISSAEAEADRLVGLAKEAGNKAFIRRACGWRAVVYREQSRYPKAIADFEMAESCAENELQLMEIWLDKGMTLVYANRYEEAEKMLQGAISIAQKYNDINSQGTAWNNLGICFGQQRKSRPAIEAYDRAIALYLQTGYKLGSAMASGNLSEIYLSRGQLDKALELSRQCQKLGAEAEDIISIALGQDIAGSVMTELEDFAGAAGSYQESLRIFCEVNDAVAQVMCGFHLILCLANSGNIPAAGEYYRQMEAVNYEGGQQRKNYYLVMAMAAILLAEKKYAPARDLLEKQLDEMPAPSQEMGEMILQLAGIYVRLGDSTKSLKMLERLLTIPEEKMTGLFMVKMHSGCWTIYSGMGRHREAGEQKSKGLALLKEMSERYTDRGLWEKYCRKKEIRILLDQ